MIKGLEHLAYKEKLKSLGFSLSLEKPTTKEEHDKSLQHYALCGER